MRRFILLILCLSSLFFVALTGQAQIEVTNYGDIPLDRLSSGRWANYEWKGPGDWKVIDVTKEGIQPNSNEDIGQKLNDLMSKGNGHRIFKFPAGKFNFRSSVWISGGKSNIQIIGEGNQTKFLFAGGENSPTIYIRGSKSGNYKMASDAKRLADKITLTNTDGIWVGAYIILTQNGSGPRPNDPETQTVKVIAKNGNTLTIDTKLGLTFEKSRTEVARFGTSLNVKLSNFYFERTSKPILSATNKRSFNIDIANAIDVEISNIEMNKTLSTHISLSRCTNVLIKNNNLYRTFGGSGGTGGGITMNFCSKIYVIGNRTSDMRHHIVTQFGTDHCVIAYNRAEAPYQSYQDIGHHNSKGCHNNLFEGNFGRQIYDDNNTKKGWGTRYNMWYRNHATEIIGASHAGSDNNNIIGNEFKSGNQGNAIAKGSNNFVGANIFGVNKEGGTGNLVWKDLKSGATLPASLFLKKRPSYSYVVRWPLYGPKATVAPDAIGPEGYSYSTSEAGTVSISNVPYDIAFGQDGKYVFLENQTKDVSCDNIAFGSDPFPGTKKYCFVKESRVPYTGNPISIPGVLEAEYYDYGGVNVSYSDSDTENKGADFSNFRVNEGVDIGSGTGGNGIGWTADGEWTEYTVDVESTSDYNLGFVVASKNGGGKLGLDLDGKSLLTGVVVPQTNDWDSYTSFTEKVSLDAGKHVVRFKVEKSGFNLDKIEVQKVVTTGLENEISSVSVFPNPSETGIYQLSLKKEYVVYSIQGERVITDFSEKIDLSSYPDGVYILQIGDASIKLIK